MSEAHDIARNAAQRLAAKYGEDLPVRVEQVLLGLKPGKIGDAAPEKFGKIGDTANVAMAIAAYAALAWTIWHDLSAAGKKPESEAIHLELRLKLPALKGINNATRDEIIITVVEEVMKK